MKLNVDFKRLIAARKSIGADEADISQISTEPRNLTSHEAILVGEGSLILTRDELDTVLHFPAGISAIGNTQITLHILQPFVSLEDLQQTPSPNPKFHFADCTTLENMRQKGRFDRYVSTYQSDGYFRVEPWDRETKTRGDEMRSNLAPCQNCLKHSNYDDFESKNRIERKSVVNNFDIQKFLENYKPIFRCLPLYNADNFPEGNYTADWARISENMRISANWTCGKCGVYLAENRHLLHVHHLDGNRGNNRRSNLKTLCCVCHQNEPFHKGMRIKSSDRKTIETLRGN